MSSGGLKYWELLMGGYDGGVTMMPVGQDPAIATGLKAHVIEVRSATTFLVLTGNEAHSVSSAYTIDFKVDNGLTGISVAPGYLFSGYGRHFTDIRITAGQITYYTRADD